MQKCFFILFFILTALTGCKKDDANPIITELQKSLVVNSISGQLSNWSYYRYYCAELDGFGTAAIDENGKFAISTLTEPAQQQLKSVGSLFDTLKTKPVISDNTAGYYYISSLSMAKVKSPEKIVGYIQNSGGVRGKNYYTTSYIYFNKAVTLNGYALRTYGSGSWIHYRKEHYNNITFEKGWNKIIYNFVSSDEASNTDNIEILREEPVEGAWMYSDPLKTVSISGSTAYAGLKFPLCIDNGYKRSAALYTADEIGSSGDITRISWKALTRTADQRPVKIYMKETDKDKLESEALDAVMTDAVKVYEGTAALLTEYWNWNDFNLIESFHLSGNKNLLVIVETNYGNKGITDDCYFEYSVLSVNRMLTWAWNNTSVQQFGSSSTSRPNIKLTIDNY